MIVRGGELIVDANLYPYDGNSPHDLASVAKSIMTTLIGIAVDQGKLNLDQPMLSFFPDATLANRDAAREKIIFRHLANISNGFESTGMAQDEGTTVPIGLDGVSRMLGTLSKRWLRRDRTNAKRW